MNNINSVPTEENSVNTNIDINMDAGNVVQELSDCSSITRFEEVVGAILARLGFTHFAFQVLDSFGARTLTNFPEKIKEFYLVGDFSGKNIFVEHARMSNKPIFISNVKGHLADAPYSSDKIEKNMEYIKLLQDNGFEEGYFFPVGFGSQNKALLSIFSEHNSREQFLQIVNRCVGLLHMMAGMIAHFGNTAFFEYFLEERNVKDLKITPKPLRVLQAVATEGLLLREAAAKLNISLDTANKHIAAVKQSLGAATLAQATYKATRHGLLKIDDEKPTMA